MNQESTLNRPVPKGRFRAAFTLLELLVSLTVLSLLLLLVFSMIDRTQEGWSAAEARVSQFREARNGFELVTRRVSQAVLNSYWDYDIPPSATVAAATQIYGRQSELHFVCGPIESFSNSAGALTTHGVFFQAPLGFTADEELRKRNLGSLLNTCGYYVEYGGDAQFKPPFVLDIEPDRQRFRLMEYRPPAEEMDVYETLKNKYRGSLGASSSYGWFRDALNPSSVGGVAPARPVAENIVALVLRPKKSELEDGTPTDIAPTYVYNTRAWQDSATKNTAHAKRSRNLLPPLIEVTVVAVAERSMVRYQQLNGESQPSWADDLFDSSSDDTSYKADLTTLEDRLKADNMDYRIFTETVGIRGSKWGEITVTP